MHFSVVERRRWWPAFNFSNETNPKRNIDDSACPALKGLCHDSAHAWAVTVADCLWTNRKRVTCTRGNLHNSIFIVREARVFRTFLFDFIYPHNSYLFSGIPQINVAANKNKITNPVLLWSKHLATCIFMYPREKTSLRSAIIIIWKQTFFFTKTPILKNCPPEHKSSCRTCAEACHSPFK